MQALIPAAGIGKRLGKHYGNAPKCMLKVGKISLIERAIAALKDAGVKRLIIVAGYQSTLLSSFIQERSKDMDISIIDNPLYETTNNIYTLYLARTEMVKEDTILLESDLIFDQDLLSILCQTPDADMAVLDRYDPAWMDGTVALLNDEKQISSFNSKNEIIPEKIGLYYKTVNIYKFSKEFSRETFMPALSSDVENGNLNQYYETILGKITEINGPCLSAFLMNGRKWYEIDNEKDLTAAKVIFQ